MKTNKKYKALLIFIILTYLILLCFRPVSSGSTITLIADGNKNDLSKGAEVWLNSVIIDGKKANLSEYAETGKWKHNKTAIVYIPSATEENENLILSFPNASDIRLVFSKHAWSGFVGVEDGMKYTELDLYDLQGEVEYQVQNVVPFNYPIFKFIISSTLIAFFAYLILKISMILPQSSKKRRVLFCGLVFLAIGFLLRIFSIKYIGFIILIIVLIYNILYNNDRSLRWIKKYQALWGMVFICWIYQICFFDNSFLPNPWVVYTVLGALDVLLVMAPGCEKKVSQYIVVFSSPFLCFCIIESVSNINLKSLTLEACVINILILAICNIIIVNLLDYKKIGWYLVYLISFLVSVVNYYVIQFKKFALMPSDVLQFRTAMAIAGDYRYELSASIVIGFLIFLFAVILTYLYIPNIKYNPKVCCQKKGVAICAVAMLAFWLQTIDFTQTYHVEKDDWDTSVTYSKSGFMLSFASYMQTMRPKKPEGYSLERVKEILEPYSDNDELLPEEKPIIIAIMNESFSDLNELGDLLNTENVMHFYDSYDGFLEKGNTYTSVRGGGTCNSEFEFLSGNSMKYFADTYPYTLYNFDSVPTLVSSLKETGYRTIAMHPAGATNYKRQTVYEQMGFDQFYSYNDYQNCVPLFYDRISDFDNYQKIIEIVDSTEEPLFIFNVTIQNHGFYDLNALNPKNPLNLVNVDSAYNSFDDLKMYLSLINESNKALEYLIKHFEQEERPVIICFFGDHQPGCLNADFEKSFFEYNNELSNLANSQRYYATPYFFWTNYDIEVEGSNELMHSTSPNYLGAQLLNYSGLPMTAYEKFLIEMQKNILAVNRFGYLGNDGSWYQYNEDTPYTRWIEEYELLQYYHMFDN